MPSISPLTALCFLVMIPLEVNTMDVSEKKQQQLVLADKQQKQFNGNIQNLLIHPSKNMFAEFILPYLSPNAILQIYGHFKKSNPNLDLPTFLDIYHFQSNILWGFEEEYIFYSILGNKSALIYSKKNETPTVFENVSYPDTLSEEILALLPSKNIIPFQLRTFNSRNGLIFAKNPKGCDFFIALLSKSNGKISVVAHGAAEDINIAQNLHLIWEAYTNKSVSSIKMKFIRTVTIPYLRYLHSHQVSYKKLYQKCSFRIVKLIFGFLLYIFHYYTSILPFVVLLLPLECLYHPIGIYLPILIFIIITWPFIAQVQKSVQPINLFPNFFPNFNFCLISPEQLNIFVIKPQKLMWKFPLLMQIQNPETSLEKIDACFLFLILHILLFVLPFFLFVTFEKYNMSKYNADLGTGFKCEPNHKKFSQNLLEECLWWLNGKWYSCEGYQGAFDWDNVPNQCKFLRNGKFN